MGTVCSTVILSSEVNDNNLSKVKVKIISNSDGQNAGKNVCEYDSHSVTNRGGIRQSRLHKAVYESYKLNGTENKGQHFRSTSKEEVNELLAKLGPGELFCDPDFPADSRILKDASRQVTWLRPKDILKEGEPQMMVDGLTKDDIRQGQLADCWFLSSCAAVSLKEKFIKKVIPPGQVLYGPQYKGIVWFSFWRFGKYIDIFIDDRLPTTERKLIYAYCTDPKEFWVALIEKAYAKIHGSYQNLEGGQTMDALVDLTGGFTERYNLNANQFHLISRSHSSGAIITCSKRGNWRSGETGDNGLVSGHAYTVTDVRKIHVHEMGEAKLIRIRNPWGDAIEWKGAWSDDDENWKRVDEETKQQLQIAVCDDGEFWMAFKDFCHHFEEITLCLMNPSYDQENLLNLTCHMEVVTGSWVTGINAGGSRKDLQLFSTNPQYLLTLLEPDDFNPSTDDAESEGMCNVVIALMQGHRRQHHSSNWLHICFVLYETKDPTRRLCLKHFQSINDCGRSGTCINLREVSGRFSLYPGHYVIIPSTFTSNTQGEFMLRVLGDKCFTLKQILD